MRELLASPRQSDANRRRFTPARGGHAPGHLRERFADLLEAYVSFPEGSDQAEYAKIVSELHELTGKLWNCTDQMSSLVRSDFESLLGRFDKPPFTFSQGARFLRLHLEQKEAAVLAGAMAPPSNADDQFTPEYLLQAAHEQGLIDLNTMGDFERGIALERLLSMLVPPFFKPLRECTFEELGAAGELLKKLGAEAGDRTLREHFGDQQGGSINEPR